MNGLAVASVVLLIYAALTLTLCLFSILRPHMRRTLAALTVAVLALEMVTFVAAIR